MHPSANKKEIAKAIEAMFDVTVLKVNTVVRKGKAMGLGYRSFKRADTKRALVKLKEGDSIDFFEGV